jgi:Putative Actinobacterial Holin-X, holin superfamily III
MTTDDTRRGIPELFGSVFKQLAELMRTEGMLARTEMSEKISRMGVGIALLVGGAMLAMPALVVLLDAAVAALVENSGLAPHWAALVVGGACLLAGLLLVMFGISRLGTGNLIPVRTLQQLQNDATAARNASNQVRTSDVEKRAA